MHHCAIVFVLIGLSVEVNSCAFALERVEVANGALEGVCDSGAGVCAFKGIPYAAPPVGELRWKPPQPAANWSGVRKAEKFGPRAMQRRLFGDMVFRSNGMSEDCLYLNVWTSAQSAAERQPVLVYFYGGGLVGGDGSEPRYDGENMARRGIVSVTVNYRLTIFGFFSHPELTKESPQQASGNYGLLDQVAALLWVQQNIAAFGGDPARVTIAGESAGSISVCALMASPLAKGLIAGAIGESGALIGPPMFLPTLKEGEATGVKFAGLLGSGEAPTLAALRAMPAEKVLEATAKPGLAWPAPIIDGYFLPKPPIEIYAAGEQAHVPLMAGVNSEESGYGGILRREKPTVENYRKALERLYPGKADDVFKFYNASNEDEVMDAAMDLASDRFISYGTWKWAELQMKRGAPTYYYLYAKPRPAMTPKVAANAAAAAAKTAASTQPRAEPPKSRGAAHSAEIEYAMGNLATNKVYAWTPDDETVSRTMQAYFANFIKTGNPNGPGVPCWPMLQTGRRQIIHVCTRAENAEKLRMRYEFMEPIFLKKPGN